MTPEANSGKLPSYEQPPLTEVACSVLFQPIAGLLSPYIGLLWQEFQPDYPICDDVAPIAPRIETFGQQSIGQKIELSQIPQLPRVWFIHQDSTRIIQVQRDRFIYNWRKIDPQNEYPRYEILVEAFYKHLTKFNDFLKETDLGEIQLLQYELTYINQIPQGQIWSSLDDIGKVFPDISWGVNPQRFLTHPQNISWATIFELPKEFGRLYVSVNPAFSNDEQFIMFELTVRGIGSSTSFSDVKNWFNSAHHWIVRAFADLTDKEVQTRVWKRRD